MGANERRRLAWALVLFGISFFVAPIQADEGVIRTGCYVFEPVRSTILQTGGFAGVHWTYAVEGRFCLIVDPDAATARFERIDANAVDVSEPVRTLDPNAVFNLRALAGDVADETIEFAGQTDDGSSVHLTLAFADDTVHLTGQTTPPPNSADFFLFSIDALATRKYAGGTGDPNAPYQIATAEQMNAIGTHPDDWNRHFQLTADIDLSAFDGKDGRPAFNIIAPDMDAKTWDFQGVPFTGVFDGNGRSISNFVYSPGESKMSHVGLFGMVGNPDAEIRNLRLMAPRIDAWADFTGGLVGHLKQGTLLNCHAVDVDIEGHDGCVGGLVGRGGSDDLLPTNSALITLRNCSSTGRVLASHNGPAGGLVGMSLCCHIFDSCSTSDVNSTHAAGGLIGHGELPRAVNCYTTGGITGGTFAGGLVGDSNGGTLMNCYSASHLSGSRHVGGCVGFPGGIVISACFWDAEINGRIDQAGATGRTTAEMQDMKTFIDAGWDFIGPDEGPSDIWTQPTGGGYPILWWQVSELPELPFSAGSGSASDPYVIETPSQLNSIGHNPRLMTAHFRLATDIDLSGMDSYLIGCDGYPYSGVFDGGDFTISNFSHATTEKENVGLFRLIEGHDAEVRKLTLVDPVVDGAGSNCVGSLVGRLEEGTIRNCHVSGGWVSGRHGVGGLVGQHGQNRLEAGILPSKVMGCSAAARVTGKDTVGGLIGVAGENGLVVDCHATGDVTGVTIVGGLTGGHYSATVRNCSTGGQVTGERMVGGLAGQHIYGVLEYCFSTAHVEGKTQVGGLVGVNGGRISDCYSAGSAEGEDAVGGLAGYNGYVVLTAEFPGTILRCYGAATVSGKEDVGGLTGCELLGWVLGSFWDVETSGWTTSPVGRGLTTAQMQTAATFLDAGWDFVGETANGTDEVWWILEGQDYPRLWWEAEEIDY